MTYKTDADIAYDILARLRGILGALQGQPITEVASARMFERSALLEACEAVLADCAAVGIEPFSAEQARTAIAAAKGGAE